MIDSMTGGREMARGIDLGKLEAWRRRLTTFQSSGLTVAAFCQQQGIGPARFYYWSRRVRQAGEVDKTEPSISAMRTSSSKVDGADDGPSVEVFIGSQIRVRLPASEPELITSVISSVRASHADFGSDNAPAAFQRIDLVPSAAARR